MDLTALITTGKIEKDVTLGEYTFHLETPQVKNITGADANIDVAISMTTRITRNFKNEEGERKTETNEFTTPEAKKILREKLFEVQGGVLSWLVNQCDAVAKEQNDAIEALSKK